MTTVLRPYQHSALDRVRASIAAGHRRILVASPTGSGKTVMATEGIVRPTVANGHRVLFIAHRQELIEQCAAKLDGMPVGIIKAGFLPRPDAMVQVASVQTLARRRLPPARVIIWDESHHAVADTYRRIAEAYGDAIHIGLTATPYRTNGQGLKDCFTDLVEVCTTIDLINLGFLVPARTLAPPAPDLKGVQTVGGDYSQDQLATAVDKPKLVGDIVATYQKHAAGRRAICFAVNIEHSQHITASFRASGIEVAHLDGSTPADQRREMIWRLGNGDLRVICNVGVLTEGTDIPPVSAIILARPTKSRGLWKQMVGRGLRPAPDKRDCLILDHAGCYHRHGIITDCEDLTLEGVTKRVSTGAAPVKQCMACYAVVPAALLACDQCGVEFPKAAPRELETEAGELVDVSGQAPGRRPFLPDAPKEVLKQLIGRMIQHGYKAGWVGYKFKERYGRWPCSMKDLEGLIEARRQEMAAEVQAARPQEMTL